MDFDDLNWRSGLLALARLRALEARQPPVHARAGPTGRGRRHRTSIAAAAHPGYAATNLQTAGIGLGTVGTLLKPLMKVGNVLFAQSDAMGALPTLYAATAPDVEGDDYFGPDGIGEQRGHPTRVGRTGRAATATTPGGSGRSPRS